MSDIDNDKVGALVGKMLGDLGGAFSVPTARIGFRLGLFDALHRHGAARISELAGRTGLAERVVNGHSRRPPTATSLSMRSRTNSA